MLKRQVAEGDESVAAMDEGECLIRIANCSPDIPACFQD